MTTKSAGQGFLGSKTIVILGFTTLLLGCGLGQEVQPPRPPVRISLFEEYPTAEFHDISGWGPQLTRKNENFNVQPHGGSAFWITITGLPAGVVVSIDDFELQTMLMVGTITAALPEEFAQLIVNTPGLHEIYLVSKLTKAKQKVGDFRVLDSLAVRKKNFASTEFCEATNWGPRSTEEGRAFNVQPNGDSAFWISAIGVPPGVTLAIGGLELQTSVTPELITAAVPKSAAPQLLDNQKSYELFILDSSRDLKQKVGEFVVTRRISRFRKLFTRVKNLLGSRGESS